MSFQADIHCRFKTAILEISICMINNVGLLGLKVFISVLFCSFFLVSKKCANYFCRESANENKQFKETKTWIFISSLIRPRFLGDPRNSEGHLRVTWNYAHSPFYWGLSSSPFYKSYLKWVELGWFILDLFR